MSKCYTTFTRVVYSCTKTCKFCSLQKFMEACVLVYLVTVVNYDRKIFRRKTVVVAALLPGSSSGRSIVPALTTAETAPEIE